MCLSALTNLLLFLHLQFLFLLHLFLRLVSILSLSLSLLSFSLSISRDIWRSGAWDTPAERGGGGVTQIYDIITTSLWWYDC